MYDNECGLNMEHKNRKTMMINYHRLFRSGVDSVRVVPSTCLPVTHNTGLHSRPAVV